MNTSFVISQSSHQPCYLRNMYTEPFLALTKCLLKTIASQSQFDCLYPHHFLSASHHFLLALHHFLLAFHHFLSASYHKVKILHFSIELLNQFLNIFSNFDDSSCRKGPLLSYNEFIFFFYLDIFRKVLWTWFLDQIIGQTFYYS